MRWILSLRMGTSMWPLSHIAQTSTMCARGEDQLEPLCIWCTWSDVMALHSLHINIHTNTKSLEILICSKNNLHYSYVNSWTQFLDAWLVLVVPVRFALRILSDLTCRSVAMMGLCDSLIGLVFDYPYIRSNFFFCVSPSSSIQSEIGKGEEGSLPACFNRVSSAAMLTSLLDSPAIPSNPTILWDPSQPLSLSS